MERNVSQGRRFTRSPSSCLPIYGEIDPLEVAAVKSTGGMERNASQGRRFLMSPSTCLPISGDFDRLSFMEYRSSSGRQYVNKWRSAIRKFQRKWKDVYGPKQLPFYYDADSYALNFDDGLWSEEPTNSIHDGALHMDHKCAIEST